MAYKHTLERNQDKVIRLVLDGLSDAQVAERMSTRGVTVTRQAVTQFRRRHADKLTTVKAEVIKAVQDYAIADKVYRIGVLDKLASLMVAEVDAKGIMLTETTFSKEGEKTYESRELHDKLVKEIRGVLKDAADELGQIPKAAPEVNVNVGLLVRYVEGG